MYKIDVKDENSKERVFVICPDILSVKDWIFTQLLHAMRENVMLTVSSPTMHKIVRHYDTQLTALEDFRGDGMANATFSTFYGVEYEVSNYIEL